MAKRKGVSKKTRFDVFKRDGFKCQYCGAVPPDAILHVDHIVPVAGGGDNDPDNLVTACAACNGGKSDRPLDTAPASMLMAKEELTERREQMKAYAQWKLEKRQHKDAEIKLISAHWCNLLLPPDQQNTYRCGTMRERSLKIFLSKGMADEDITELMEVAVSVCCPSFHNDDRAWRYFCGCCWHHIREGSGEAAE